MSPPTCRRMWLCHFVFVLFRRKACRNIRTLFIQQTVMKSLSRQGLRLRGRGDSERISPGLFAPCHSVWCMGRFLIILFPSLFSNWTQRLAPPDFPLPQCTCIPRLQPSPAECSQLCAVSLADLPSGCPSFHCPLPSPSPAPISITLH